MFVVTGRISGPILLCLGLTGFIGGIVWVRKRVAARKARERNERAMKQLDDQLGNQASKYYISDRSLANLNNVFVTKTSADFDDSRPSTSRQSSSIEVPSFSREPSVSYSRHSSVEIQFRNMTSHSNPDYVDMKAGGRGSVSSGLGGSLASSSSRPTSGKRRAASQLNGAESSSSSGVDSQRSSGPLPDSRPTSSEGFARRVSVPTSDADSKQYVNMASPRDLKPTKSDSNMEQRYQADTSDSENETSNRNSRGGAAAEPVSNRRVVTAQVSLFDENLYDNIEDATEDPYMDFDGASVSGANRVEEGTGRFDIYEEVADVKLARDGGVTDPLE